ACRTRSAAPWARFYPGAGPPGNVAGPPREAPNVPESGRAPLPRRSVAMRRDPPLTPARCRQFIRNKLPGSYTALTYLSPLNGAGAARAELERAGRAFGRAGRRERRPTRSPPHRTIRGERHVARRPTRGPAASALASLRCSV